MVEEEENYDDYTSDIETIIYKKKEANKKYFLEVDNKDEELVKLGIIKYFKIPEYLTQANQFGPRSCMNNNPYHKIPCDPPSSNIITISPFIIWVLANKMKIIGFKNIGKLISFFIGHNYCYECNNVYCSHCSSREDILIAWRQLNIGPVCCDCFTNTICIICHSNISRKCRSPNFDISKPICEGCIFTMDDKCSKCDCKRIVCYKDVPCGCDSCKKNGCQFYER
jgi:hypothetical protein